MDVAEVKDFYRGNLRRLVEAFDGYGPLVELGVDKVVIVGDVHGDLHTVSEVLNKYSPSNWAYVFLGDYVDRGEWQLETLTLLLRLKLRYGDRFVMLRGNHETQVMNMEYGFYRELLKKLGPEGALLYEDILDIFSRMPLAAVLNNEYFLVHGGLPVVDIDLGAIRKLPKPDRELSNDVSIQLLWNDPSDDVVDHAPNLERGPGTYYFGRGITERFLSKSGLKMLVRAHEYVIDGYKWNHGGKVLTIFTSRAGPYRAVRAKVALLEGGELRIVPVVP